MTNPNTLVDVFGLSALLPDLRQQPSSLLTDQSLSNKPDFYVNSSGDTLPSTDNRYMRYLEDDGSVNKYVSKTITVKEAPGSYFGFKKYFTGKQARDAFQIRGPEFGDSWSDARLRGEFDTLQLFDPVTGKINGYIPTEDGGRGTILEPFTRYYPEYGDGGVPGFQR